MDILKKLLVDELFQNTCAVCGENTKDSQSICKNCTPHSLELSSCPSCMICKEQIDFGESVCSNCQTFQVPYSLFISKWIYQEKVESLIKAYKIGKKRSLENYLTEIFCQLICDTNLDKGLIISFIPSTHRRNSRRGFAHMKNLSKKVSLKTGYQLFPNLLTRNENQKPNTASKNRVENSKGMFLANLDVKIKGKSIILIDDVVTTGSSILFASSCLKNAGAKHVYVFSLARSKDYNKKCVKGLLELSNR